MRKHIYRAGAVALSCFLALGPSIRVCATSPAPLPPNLALVEPEIRVMRGNAYQYALEQKGYDIRYGNVSPLDVLTAMEAASRLADAAYEGTDEYDATIQYIKDKSGLPDELQGLNAELYFAKITYLDMQLGIYLDETGKRVGNAIVQYTDAMDEKLEAIKKTIRHNVLGKSELASIGIDAAKMVRVGKSAYDNTDSSLVVLKRIYRDNLAYRGEVTYVGRYEFSSSLHDGAVFALLKTDRGEILDYPYRYLVVSKETPFLRVICAELDGKHTIKDLLASSALSTSMFKQKNWGERYGYSCWTIGTDEPLSAYDTKLCYYSCPFTQVEMNLEDCRRWFLQDFRPDFVGDKLVLVNPNGKNKTLTKKAYDYDTVAEHCEAVVSTKPDFVPNTEPLPEPLPENAPVYPPVSDMESVPAPKPSVMPDYGPVVSPDPVPDPDPLPEPDPDIPDAPDAVMPISGIRDKFPFCVPYDLMEAFRLMSAEPETPVWRFEFPVPYTDETEVLVIDLSPFNGLARLTRTLLLLAFIVALAVGTRNLIAH